MRCRCGARRARARRRAGPARGPWRRAGPWRRPGRRASRARRRPWPGRRSRARRRLPRSSSTAIASISPVPRPHRPATATAADRLTPASQAAASAPAELDDVGAVGGLGGRLATDSSSPRGPDLVEPLAQRAELEGVEELVDLGAVPGLEGAGVEVERRSGRRRRSWVRRRLTSTCGRAARRASPTLPADLVDVVDERRPASRTRAATWRRSSPPRPGCPAGCRSGRRAGPRSRGTAPG